MLPLSSYLSSPLEKLISIILFHQHSNNPYRESNSNFYCKNREAKIQTTRSNFHNSFLLYQPVMNLQRSVCHNLCIHWHIQITVIIVIHKICTWFIVEKLYRSWCILCPLVQTTNKMFILYWSWESHCYLSIFS